MSVERRINEHVMQEGVKHDAANHVLLGVKIIAPDSLNHRRYEDGAVSDGLRLYEGRMVNIDHPATASQPRGLASRFGKIRNVRKDGPGSARGDLPYNPMHPMAPCVVWFAENMPEALGLSHDAIGQGRDEDGVFVVERIVSVRSVDLVADPATTKGLYEGVTMPDPMNPDPAGAGGLSQAIASGISAIVADKAMDKKAKLKKIGKLLDLDCEDEPAKPATPAPEVRTVTTPADPTLKALAEQLDAAKVELAVLQRKNLATKVLAESMLPDLAITDYFRGKVAECKDEAEMKALIEDRRRIAGVQKPTSAGRSGGVPLTEAQFKAELFKGA